MASRWSVSTAMVAVAPTVASAASSASRVDVPGRWVTMGRPASAVRSRRARGACVGGRMATSSCRPRGIVVMRAAVTGSSVMPSSLSPERTSSTSSSVPSGWARRMVTPGCWTRNAPTSGVTGSTARVGRATRSRWPATTPPTASTSARSVARARSASLAGDTNASPAAVRAVRRPMRANRSTPSSRSRVRIAWEREGWATKQASAAAVKVPWSTTART